MFKMGKRGPLFLLLTALLVCLCACGDTSDTPVSEPVELSASDFADAARGRDENYAAVLKTKAVALDGLTVHIAEDLFDEETSPALVEQIAADHAALRDLGGELAGPAEVYVLSLTATGAPVVAGTELFCPLELIESGDYRPYLVETVFDRPSWWQCVGLSRAVFGPETEAGLAAALKSHLEQDSDTYLLSLFPSYFLEDFAGEEIRALAAQTAQSLTEYILSETDPATFLAEGNDASYRAAWLERIGVPAELDYLKGDAAAHVAGLPWSESKDFSLILTDRQFTLDLQRTDWLTTADDAYYFTLDFYQSLERLCSFLEAEAPGYYASLQRGEIKHFSIKVYDSGYTSGSSARADKGEAVVVDWPNALHEAVHCLIPESLDEHYDDWLSEGLATWLSAPYISIDAGGTFVDNFVKNVDLAQLPEDVGQMVETCWNVFEQLTGREASGIYEMNAPEDKPMYWLYQALTRSVMLRTDLDVSIPLATQPIMDRRGFANTYPGNRLSYGKAMLFTEYLVERYGLDTVIAALMDGAAYHELFPDEKAFNEEYDRFLDALAIP